jgi:hypothetical protein
MRRYAIPADVACASVEDGAVVLHMGTKRYFSLNETGAAIWRLLEEDVPLDHVPRRLSERYEVELEDARLAVDSLLAALREKTLLIMEPQ